MITLNKQPGQRILELGGGGNRHPQADCNVDIRPAPDVDFQCNLEEPLPINDQDFDAVFSQYCLEHLSWRKVPDFLKEVLRVLKPGGKAIFVVPNTFIQLEWASSHPGGWDGKDFFQSVSCVLYGDQDYPKSTP